MNTVLISILILIVFSIAVYASSMYGSMRGLQDYWKVLATLSKECCPDCSKKVLELFHKHFTK